MRKSVSVLLLAAAFCLLAGCSKQNHQPAASSAGTSSSAPPAQSAPAASSSPAEDPKLTVSDARGLLAETIDTDTYLILNSGTHAKIDDDDYYVFLIAAKKDNTAIGQVAVNARTGEKYNYKGQNKISDYADFELYDASADAVIDWEGTFSDGTRTLELIPMDERSFEYMLDDLNGVARGTGNTATDEDNNLTFTYQDGVITLSGAAEGDFTRTE